MKHNNLPPSPFGAGTTYDGQGGHIVPPDREKEIERPIAPRIARDAGSIALENTVAVSNAEGEREAKMAHMQRLFAFPDVHDDRMHTRTATTKESLRDALDAYIATSDDIKRIVNQFADGGYMRQADVAAAIRDNDELRLELGKSLLDKLSHTQFLPSRLNNDSEIKRPNVQGYDEQMTSKEYAALLAISMLDGTYKDSPGDKIYIDRYGEVRNGQHRYAAQEVLGIGKIARNRERQ